MTLIELQAKRDEILSTLGMTAAEYQSRRLQFSSGDARLKEIAFLDEQIQDATDAGTTIPRTRCTLATFRRS